MVEHDRLEELVESLLYEGYALYPYTPGATKNATPTPFGIVYPPAYAAECAGAFDHLRMECALPADAPVTAVVRFLQATGARHQATERRIELTAEEPVELEFESISLRARLRKDALDDGRIRVRCCVHNTTDVPSGMDRTQALVHSLLSTHVLITVEGGRFESPLESGLDSINTFPVLATDDDRIVLGAAIVLPDHPQLAPESRANLFDGTEIEEALVLHVQALSDGEREDIIADGDPKLLEMLQRADAVTPTEMLGLHGRMQLRDPIDARDPRLPAGFEPDGEDEITVDGVTFRRGDKVRLRPGKGGDLLDGALAGKVATIGKLMIDYDDKAYLGVTVDDDPAAEIFGDSGRFLFFFAEEVEVVQA